MTSITFTVPGTPAPGGSKNAFALKRRDGSLVMRGNTPIINIVDAGKGNKQWRRSVAIMARKAMGSTPPFVGPVSLNIDFTFERPASHYRVESKFNSLRNSAPKFRTQKPDALKLARSTEDAMTGIVYVDDAQVVELFVTKAWGSESGAEITVTEMFTPVKAAPLFAGA